MPAAEKSGNPAGADGTVDPLAQLSGLPSPDSADEDQGVRKLSDQQIAGAMMSAFGMPVIWIVAAVVWYRWAREEERNSPPIVRRRVVSGPDPG